jgi:hypothetical protein
VVLYGMKKNSGILPAVILQSEKSKEKGRNSILRELAAFQA